MSQIRFNDPRVKQAMTEFREMDFEICRDPKLLAEAARMVSGMKKAEKRKYTRAEIDEILKRVLGSQKKLRQGKRKAL